MRLYQTQDPWMDMGLVAFYHALWRIHEYDEDLLDQPELQPGFLSFSFDKDQLDELKQQLVEQLKEQLNSVLLPSPELKILNDTNWRKKNEDGYYNHQYKRTLGNVELKDLKTKLKHAQQEVKVGFARNFIGTNQDWENIAKLLEDEVSNFFLQWGEKPAKGKKCPLCGRLAESNSFRPMNQSKNTLFNQHHAVPVRGYKSSVSKDDMCPTCNLLNLFAMLAVETIAYFVTSGSAGVNHILIPEVNNLVSLNHLFVAIRGGLYDNLQENQMVISYRTNIKELKHLTLYASLLQLYYWLNHVRDESGLTLLKESDHSAIKGWLIPRFEKGKNILFKKFTRLAVDEDLFRMTSSILYKGGDYRGDVVNDFLNLIRCEDERIIDQIAEGILRKNVRMITQNLYQLYKRSLKNRSRNGIKSRGCQFFCEYLSCYYSFIKKEETMVFHEQLHEDLRLLGQAIGQHTDLSSLNKLNTASTQETFIAAVKEALLKIYKGQISIKKDKRSEDLYNIGTKRMAHIISQIQDHNLFLIRDTLVIYASLAGFQANNRKLKEKEMTEE